ncbi:MAG: dihydroorotase [Candidatus Eremiobacteraeota bacterium]|nr:dihydroorotase [Candidatus Eremiobacteraeota bacterium]MBC5802344.1 dihydroorotase [Candidatus Eremiobacteraeota bacterium]
MSALLIRGGRVIDPAQNLDALRDVLLRDGLVAAVGERLGDTDAARECTVYDATNAIVAPGFIDMHVHLREPGHAHKETVATGSAAAVAGGFTAVACMPNTEPAVDSPALVAEVRRLAQAAGLARVYPIAALTRARAGAELAPYWQLHDAGAVAFSDDGAAVRNPRVLRHAALYARDVPGVFISHCEDVELRDDAVMNEGVRSFELGLAGAPDLAEDLNVARDLLIAGDTGKRFHIAHLSTAMSVELMRFARAHDIAATCEVTPHHLLLDDARFERFRADAKVNPPLRAAADVRALRDAVRDGSIDVFATDHAPHTAQEKARLLSEAPPGFSGLEIAVGAYAHALPDLPLSRFIALLSTNPARILGVPGGTLALGAPADITIFAERPWRVDAAAFHSLGKNTPFDGADFQRRPIATIVAGALLMKDGTIVRDVSR